MHCEKTGALEITEIKLFIFSLFLETEAQCRDIKRFNQEHVAVHGKPGPKADVLISRQPSTGVSRTEISFFGFFVFILDPR